MQVKLRQGMMARDTWLCISGTIMETGDRYTILLDNCGREWQCYTRDIQVFPTLAELDALKREEYAEKYL